MPIFECVCPRYGMMIAEQFFFNLTNFLSDLFFQWYESKVNGSTKKTVMIFIHGGAFASGDATDTSYGPDFLLSQDNILVTLQSD